MRVARRAWVIAALLALAVAAFGLAACSPSASDIEAQHRDQCFANQRQIKMAIDVVNADSGIYPDVKNVVAELKLKCPDGGTYAFDANANTVSCSVHGAAPAASAQ